MAGTLLSVTVGQNVSSTGALSAIKSDTSPVLQPCRGSSKVRSRRGSPATHLSKKTTERRHTGTRCNYSHQSFFICFSSSYGRFATPFNLTQRPRRPQSFPSLRTTQMLPPACLGLVRQGGASVCWRTSDARPSSRCSARNLRPSLPRLPLCDAKGRGVNPKHGIWLYSALRSTAVVTAR